MLRKIPVTTLPLLILVFVACRKDVRAPKKPDLQVQEIATSTGQPGINISANNTLLPTDASHNFVFDWEHTDLMPVAPWVSPVPVPWSDQAVRHFDEGLRYDFKKIDGWELVYSTFSDSLNWSKRYFVLYNKFRGVLRYYFHNPLPVPADIKTARHVINMIQLPHSTPSPVFNFADQHIVDIDANSRQASLLEPAFLEEQGWYISQLELAYDPQYVSRNFMQFSFQESTAFSRMQDMTFNNAPVSNSDINLQQARTDFTANAVRYSPLTGNFQCLARFPNDFDQLPGIFPAGVINQIKNSLADSMPAQVLNGMISLPLGITNCKLEAPGTLNFVPGLIGFIVGLDLAPPGMNHSDITGIGPAFNESVGIFYLEDKPVVLHEQTSGNFREQYTLDVPSVKYIINPFIQNYADVRNFRQEIVAIDPEEEKSLTEAKIYRGNILKASAPLEIIGVRVSFEVVPKNGSAPIKIIKTFKADVLGS